MTVGGALLAAAAAGLPWATTGERTRNAFQLMRAVDSAGLAEGPGARTLIVATALLPALAAAAWVAASLRRPRLLATLGSGTGAIAMAGGVVVMRSPVEAGVGVYLALVAAALTMGGALALVRQEHR